MRSPPLLLLLITSQCCLLSFAVGDSTVEKADLVSRLRSIRDASASARPTADELTALSDTELASKVDEWNARKKSDETEVSRIEREQAAKMDEWRSANGSVIEKTDAWRLVFNENAEKSGALANLTADRKRLQREEKIAQKEVNDAKRLVKDLPTDEKDELGWCEEKLKAPSDRVRELSDTIIPALERNLRNATDRVRVLETATIDVSSNMSLYQCAAESRSNELPKCPQLREQLQQAQQAENELHTRISDLEDEQQVAGDDLKRLVTTTVHALERLRNALLAAQSAATAYAEAKRRIDELPDDVLSVGRRESEAQEAKKAAEALALTIASSARNLEKALVGAQAKLKQAEDMHKAYNDEATKRAPATTTGNELSSSAAKFPVKYAIAGVAALVLIVVIVVAVVVVIIRRKKRMKDNEEHENSIKKTDNDDTMSKKEAAKKGAEDVEKAYEEKEKEKEKEKEEEEKAKVEKQFKEAAEAKHMTADKEQPTQPLSGEEKAKAEKPYKEAAGAFQRREDAKFMTADKEQPTQPLSGDEVVEETQVLSIYPSQSKGTEKPKKPAKVKPKKTEEVIAKIPDEEPKSEKKPAAAAKGKSAKVNSSAKSKKDGQPPPPVADVKGNTGATAPVAAPPAETGK